MDDKKSQKQRDLHQFVRQLTPHPENAAANCYYQYDGNCNLKRIGSPTWHPFVLKNTIQSESIIEIIFKNYEENDIGLGILTKAVFNKLEPYAHPDFTGFFLSNNTVWTKGSHKTVNNPFNECLIFGAQVSWLKSEVSFFRRRDQNSTKEIIISMPFQRKKNMYFAIMIYNVEDVVSLLHNK